MNKTNLQLVGLGVLALALILLNVYLMHDLEYREVYRIILLMTD